MVVVGGGMVNDVKEVLRKDGWMKLGVWMKGGGYGNTAILTYT